MPTGKSWKEVLLPTVSNSNGKWMGTRFFQVATSSPSVAILTLQDDASLPLGTSWTEGCDPDYAAATTHSIRMKLSSYEVTPLSGSLMQVSVRYEDSRYRTEFDEARGGFVRKYFKFSMSSELITVSKKNIDAWNKSNPAVSYTPMVALPDSSATVPDRRVGFDGENVNGANIDLPELVYGEMWRLADEESGSFGSSSYAPGIYTNVNVANRLSGKRLYDFCKRVGVAYSPSSVIVPYWLMIFAFTGTTNYDTFRSFTPGSLEMLPPQINQVGEQTWIANFEWVFSAPYFYDASSGLEDPKIYLQNVELQELSKDGHEFMWFKMIADAEGENSVVDEVRIASVKDELNYSALGLTI
jgi:hypothetical protein